MTIALRGELADFGIADVFQLVGQQSKTGRLELLGPGESAFVLFEAGEVVGAFPGEATGDLALARRLVATGVLSRDHAILWLKRGRAAARGFAELLEERGGVDSSTLRETRDRLTRDTLFEVLNWKQGRFDFFPEDVRSARDCGESLSPERVLMDGMRQIDEWNAMGSEIPADDEVYERRCGKGEAGGPVPGPDLAQRERVWEVIDGVRTVRNAIERSGLDRFDAMCAFVALVRAGDLRPVSQVPKRPAQRRSKSAPVFQLPVGGPVVFLAALVGSMWLGSSEPRNAESLDAFGRAAEIFEASERKSRAHARRFALSGDVSPELGLDRSLSRSRSALATGGARLYNPDGSEEDFLPEPGR